jgi:hypothetical protein
MLWSYDTQLIASAFAESKGKGPSSTRRILTLSRILSVHVLSQVLFFSEIRLGTRLHYEWWVFGSRGGQCDIPTLPSVHRAIYVSQQRQPRKITRELENK